jgi:hypothetical protein
MSDQREEELDDLDRERASDMEVRPIYKPETPEVSEEEEELEEEEVAA